MTCSGVLSGHDPRTPVARYVLLTRSGPRVVELCHRCAGALDRIGAAIRPERRARERIEYRDTWSTETPEPMIRWPR